MQAVCDMSLKFLDISVGYPGSLHDARVFSLSPFYDKVTKGQLLNGPTRLLNGITVGPIIAADSAYPLSSFIIKPFSNRRRLSETQVRFNKRFSALRSVIERAFGMLKNRWRLLLKLNEQKLDNVVRSITAACVLHNICIINDDSGEEFLDADIPNTVEPSPEVGFSSTDGEDIRNAIMDYMANGGFM